MTQSRISKRGFSYKNYFLAFILGSSSAFAFAPYHYVILLLPSFSLLLYFLSRSANIKQAFFLGWWFGFGHFVFGLYWIAYSLLVDPEKFAWMIPFAVSLVPAALAVYIGIVCAITFLISRRPGFSTIIIFATLWVFAEVLRGYLFTGFPWNLLGYVWGDAIEIMQIVSVIGVYGLSFLTIFFATLPILVINKARSSFVIAIFTSLILVGVWAYGFSRLSEVEATNDVHFADVKIRIVQANIPQTLKWDNNEIINALDKHMKMSKDSGANYVIWPESAVAMFLHEELGRGLKPYLRRVIPEDGYLITGSIRKDESSIPIKIWNSIEVLDKSGDIVATYKKNHLVPFGEFVPLRNIFPFINKITPGDMDFSKGDGLKTIGMGSLPSFSPLICYEIIFPGKVVDNNKRPEWILNVTNDGWFRDSSGPYQHITMARFRAIEEGLPVIRAANTGISAVIDPYGRIKNNIPYGKVGVIDTKLPSPVSFRTIYSLISERYN